MGKADLHIHTTASDGSCDPVEIIQLASSKSLNTISITDHDTIDGYLAAVDEARKFAIRLIPGVEITAYQNRKEIHILAYDFNPLDISFRNFLTSQRKARLERMERILHYLRSSQGIDLSLDEVKAQARSTNVGRPHLAQILVRKKYVASIAEAFIRYLGSPMLDNIEIEYAGIEHVIEVVDRAAGATVLAHPGAVYNMAETEEYLNFGLDGIECIHPSHSYSEQKQFIELAEKNNLLITGGSDFHGTGREYDPFLGIVTISEQKLNRLQTMTGNRKKLQTEKD